ncbi:hypothetical protein G9A89_018779 [Geosiphon pyriformis]|nr:hypothetical protein G9A89_018779 [Geosiphon pyriformis]
MKVTAAKLLFCLAKTATLFFTDISTAGKVDSNLVTNTTKVLTDSIKDFINKKSLLKWNFREANLHSTAILEAEETTDTMSVVVLEEPPKFKFISTAAATEKTTKTAALA